MCLAIVCVEGGFSHIRSHLYLYLPHECIPDKNLMENEVTVKSVKFISLKDYHIYHNPVLCHTCTHTYTYTFYTDACMHKHTYTHYNNNNTHTHGQRQTQLCRHRHTHKHLPSFCNVSIVWSFSPSKINEENKFPIRLLL